MKSRVLIVEDILEMSELISMYLSREGLETRSSESGEAALAALETFEPDLIILDINLPGMDGFEFLHEFRKTHDCQVLIVSARDADEDIITGLGYGADEFVTKPFSPRVLVARVRALLRRSSGGRTDSSHDLTFGPYQLDMEACVLRRGKDRVPLSAREYGVLEFLCSNSGKTQSPEEIYKNVWKNEYGDITAVAVYIQRLRKKIEDDSGNPVYIQTIHGRGYCFCPGEDVPS
jgi:DNA-binding response OmpR family regulator